MDAFALVMGWVSGLFTGAVVALGVFDVATGRAHLNPRRVRWSVGEARARGALMIAFGSVMGTFGLVLMFIEEELAAGMGFQWWYSYWSRLIAIAIPVFVIATTFGLMLTEQHNKGGWPFSRSSTPSQPTGSATS